MLDAKPVRRQLRGGEDVAQIVLDLGDRSAQRRQMLALLQRLAQLRLHRREHALGLADLVGARARLDDALRIVGPLLKAHHRLRHALHRPHEEDSRS